MESVIVLALVTIFLVGQWLMLRGIASKDRAAREALARYGDDIQVSGFTVETDTLLDPPNSTDDNRNAKIVVTVELRPYYPTPFNLSFV